MTASRALLQAQEVASLDLLPVSRSGTHLGSCGCAGATCQALNTLNSLIVNALRIFVFLPRKCFFFLRLFKITSKLQNALENKDKSRIFRVIL